MATLTANGTQTVLVGANVLSAIGPDQSQNYGLINITLAQSPVTAFVTGYSFSNPAPYANEPGLFYILTTGLSAASVATPILISSSGGAYTSTAQLNLSVLVLEAALGPQTASLVLSLSTTALSSASGVNGGTVPITVDPTCVVALSTLSLTAVNLPLAGTTRSADQQRRGRLAGYF